MCGCPEMESYEEFCLRSLVMLQEEGKFKKSTCEPVYSLKAHTVIFFHGRAVLSPLLNAEQRNEMCDYRRRAVQLDLGRQSQHKNKLLAGVQDIWDQVQIHRVPVDYVGKLPVCKSPTVSGYTLVTDSPGLPRDSGFGLRTNEPNVPPCRETPTPNYYKAMEGEMVKKEDKSDEEDEEDDISLDSLLKRSREYVQAVTGTPPPDSVPDNDNVSRSTMRDSGIEFGFSLHHSPTGPPQTHIQHHTLYDSGVHQSGCPSPSLPEWKTCLPSPESTVSPHVQRRRPRPVSTGTIHISFPVGPADLIPRGPGRSVGAADCGEAFSGARGSSEHWGSLGSDCDEDGHRGGSRRSSHCGTSPVQEICSPICTSGSSPSGQLDHLTAGFRRRCHTLDSHLHTCNSTEAIDRSQERIPRFMAGVTWLGPGRRGTTAHLNQPYDMENPPSSLLRPRVTSDLSQVKVRMESDDTQGLNNTRATPSAPRNVSEAQVNTSAGETQRQALDMQRRLQEEHSLQMSCLLAEQEQEQHRLHLVKELEVTDRILKERGSVRPLSADVSGWNRRCVNDTGPLISPSCPTLSPAHTPSERSPGHNIGFPSPVNSRVSSPSVQSPVSLWGSTWSASKPRPRTSLVLTAEQQKAFCRISAITRGFLTRRLLQTEKVKHLRQTVVDTQEFIHSFQPEGSLKKGNYSAQDLSLRERVRAQLRAALYDIHEIFFQMPLEDRLGLLQQDRELRVERKLRDMEKVKCPKERVAFSTATQRSLDRKKRSGESPAQTRKTHQKPKSPTTNRVLKLNQGQNSPASGQLNRQGSWYKKTPEERLRRSDSLKKQHSLG